MAFHGDEIMASSRQGAESSSSVAEFMLAVTIKNWRLVFASTVIALLALYAALLYYSPVYEVSASLLFKIGREMNPPATATTGGQIVSAKRPEDIVSEIEILKNQHLIEQIVKVFGVDYFLVEETPVTLFQKIKAAARRASKAIKKSFQEMLILAGVSKRMTPYEEVVATLEASLSVEPVRKSDVISIVFRTPDREGGVALMNKLIELYLRQHIEAYRTPQARSFFEQESNELRGRILSAHKDIRDFRDANGVWELGEQRRLLLRQESDLEATHMKTESQLRHVDQEIAKLEELTSGLPAQVEVSRISERNPVIAGLDDQIIKLETAREQALRKFTPESRAVVDLTSQIDGLRAARAKEERLITNSVTSSRNDTLTAVDRDLVGRRGIRHGLVAQSQAEVRQLKEIEGRLRALDRQEIDVERRNREFAQLNKNYQLYAEKLEHARISEAMDLAKISNVAVLAPPTAGVFPVWPKKRTWALAAIALGIGGALGVAFLRELIHPTVHSRAEVAMVAGAPVLGCIPEIRSARG